jgi:hypothetical protein
MPTARCHVGSGIGILSGLEGGAPACLALNTVCLPNGFQIAPVVASHFPSGEPCSRYSLLPGTNAEGL